jgi:3-oxoacyl-[acyl-carrier-protein] synthase-3
MIYSDGAGAQLSSFDDDTGMLSYESGTYAMDEAIIYF